MKKITSLVLALTMLLLFALISSCSETLLPTENTNTPISTHETLYRISADCSVPETVELIAGQNMDVGKVDIWNDDINLYVEYIIEDDDWCITETHLHVATAYLDLPQTKKGNAIPGQFDYKDEHECVSEYLYTISLENIEGMLDPEDEGYCDQSLYIAAHAVVKNQNELNVDCIDFESFEEYDAVETVSTGAGDVGFYMTNHTVLEGLVLGDLATLGPTGNLPVIAEPLNKDPDTNTMYDPTQNIVAFTVGNTFKDDWVSADPEGTGAGGKLLGDTPDFTKAPFWQHAYSDLQAILMDFTSINNISGIKFAGIDLDWNEVWYVLYFDSDNKLIHKKTLGPPSGQSQDGEAILIEYSNPNIAKVVIWGNMNGGTPGKVGYAIDNICVTTFGEETAWGEGPGFIGKDWSMYFGYVICCGTPEDPEEPECNEETAWGGNDAGGGSAWWYYFDTQGPSVQTIFAGQTPTDGTVTWDGTNLNIDLGSWSLQEVDEPVKVEGYGVPPSERPVAGLFTLYKGTDLIIPGNGSRYYAIHLDVEQCE